MAHLISVNVGMPKDVAWNGRTVRTGIWKSPVAGPQMVRRLNIDGDGQGDTAGHGGEMRAVFVYQIDSYRHWEDHLGRDDFGYGQFGENLTIDGLPDAEVCIGDRFRIGEAEFEVTQPRVTCYRVGIRLNQPDMPSLLVSHHRPGFYMRVITEGRIQAGDGIVQTRSGPGRLSVADTDALLYLPDPKVDQLRTAVTIPALSPGWQGSFREMLAAAAEPAPSWAGFRPLRVTQIVAESDSISSISLAAEDGQPLPAARAGQYLTLRVATDSTTAVRNYSLSSDPGAATYRISVKCEPHGLVSQYLHRALKAGGLLDVAAPRGEFHLSDDPGPVLLISAGVGVTPVLAMLHQLADAGTDRDVWWIHATRGPREHAHAAEAHDLLIKLAHGRERVFYSAADPDEVADHHATAGHLTSATLGALGLPADSSAYICGPAAFMTDIRAALTGLGVAPDRIHTELFGARSAINPGVTDTDRPAPHAPAGTPGDGPLVTFARSGLSVAFGRAYPSVLDLADACDVPTRWSCRTGVCHTCVTPLLAGDIGYRPQPLEPPPDGQILLCCAQPTSDLVVDL